MYKIQIITMKLKITGKIILSKIEIQTITIKHKITRKIIPKKSG